MLFYRLRYFSNPVIRAILQAFQPTTEGVLDAMSSAIIVWFKDTVLELQDSIWFAHEGLAKVFLLKTAAGKQYLLSYTKKRLERVFSSLIIFLLTSKPVRATGHDPKLQQNNSRTYFCLGSTTFVEFGLVFNMLQTSHIGIH